jgi:predicted membrane protein
MKMNWAILFGLMIVLVGTSIILNAVFHIDVPLVRTALALFLVFLGARMLLDAWKPHRAEDTDATAVMRESRFEPIRLPDGDFKYDLVFSRGILDLTRLPPPDRDVTVTVNAVFGHATIYVDPAIPYDVAGSAAFGQAKMPNRSSVAFGDTRFAPGADGAAKMHLKVNAVFGGCEVIERAGNGTARSAIAVGVPVG